MLLALIALLGSAVAVLALDLVTKLMEGSGPWAGALAIAPVMAAAATAAVHTGAGDDRCASGAGRPGAAAAAGPPGAGAPGGVRAAAGAARTVHAPPQLA
jgi:hypothetical protein